MAQRVARGVSMAENGAAILRRAGEATLTDLLTCDGLAIGSPEYFGYMSGMVKDFFDRTYAAARGRKEVVKKPYVLFVSAGNDGTGAISSIERICLGYPFKKVYDPVLSRGGVDEAVLMKCEELGRTIAEGCEARIY
jgi:multimeric flavodoxin WrbA